jgi:hypothetical protein
MGFKSLQFLGSLALILVSQMATAQESKTSFLTFTKDPLKVIRIDRLPENRIVFSQCDRSQGSLGATLSNCSTMGRAEGYTPEELNKKAQSYRRLNWLKNTVTIPAFTACAALLTGAVSAAIHYNEIVLGLVGFTLGTMEMTTLGLFSPRNMVHGGNMMVGGIMQSMVGMITVYVHTLVGGVVGVPLSWKLSRTWFPKYRNGYQALKFAGDTSEDQLVELEFKAKFSKFSSNLEKLLAQLE